MNNWTGMQFVSPFSQVCKFTLRELSSIRDNLYNCLVSELSFNYSMYKEVGTVTNEESVFQPTQHIGQERKRNEVILVSATTPELEHIQSLHPSQNLENKNKKKEKEAINLQFQGQQSQKSKQIEFEEQKDKELIGKNDTKNIPKNYGKAMLSYILKSPKTKKLVSALGIDLSDFLVQVKEMKGKINSIEGLRRMWGSYNLQQKHTKCIRMLSHQFMRKQCVSYIFNSKVRNFSVHLKYLKKILEGIEDPNKFTCIKQY